jgi:hypothetical protein
MPNACTHKSSDNGAWGCVAMCKTHSTNPYPSQDLGVAYGDADYHGCVAQPGCNCDFLPIPITITTDQGGVVTHWYKRPGKSFPANRRSLWQTRSGSGTTDYSEKVELGSAGTYQECADYCLGSDWTGDGSTSERCISFSWVASTGACHLFAESEKGTALEAAPGWDHYEQVPGLSDPSTPNWWEKPQRNPGYCSHTSMTAVAADVATCAALTAQATCAAASACTWTPPMTFAGQTQPEAPWAEAPADPVFRKRVNRALDFAAVDSAAPAEKSGSLADCVRECIRSTRECASFTFDRVNNRCRLSMYKAGGTHPTLTTVQPKHLDTSTTSDYYEFVSFV